jgi:thioredoxin 1
MSETHAALTLTNENFQSEVLDSDVPVLVDFWAAWCGPCRQIAPMIEDLAGTYEGKAKVGKIDLDANRELGTQLAVQAIPTLLFFKGGEVVERLVGVRPRAEIEGILDGLSAS